MATYFDRREQREKPVPDCSKIGLVWNPETQRAERMSAFSTILNLANVAMIAPRNNGMGFLDDYDPFDYGYDGWDWTGGGGNDFSGGGGIDDWTFDGYGYYNSAGGYYDPFSDTLYDPDSGEWLGADVNYDPGTYTETSDGAWRFEDGAGNLSEGGADGSLHEYDAATGEEIFISGAGEYTWVNAAGDSYYANPNGDWTSTGANGLVCYGDAAGNGGCTDGTQYSASGGNPNPIRKAAEATRNALGGGASGGGSPAAAKKQEAQQKAQAATKPTAPGQSNLFSQSDTKTLVYVGIGLAALMLIKK